MNSFLQSMQEREAERLKRESKKVSVQAAEREEFSNQLVKYENDVRYHLQSGQLHDAELTLCSLRSLIQDAVQTLSLTSYDMARANATVAKLQHEVDDAVMANWIQPLEMNQKRENVDPSPSPPLHHHEEQEEEEEEKEELTTIMQNHTGEEEPANSVKDSQGESNRKLNNFSVMNKSNNSNSNNNNNNNSADKQDGCKSTNKQDVHNTHKKFSFSTRCKTKVENKNINANTVKPEEKNDSKTLSMMNETSKLSVVSSQAKSYGPCVNETITIPPARAIFVNECVHCTILTFPIAGSAFICNCKECTIYLACHQLRMKDCENVEVYVACTSHPIIEHCDKMRFGSYSCWTGLLASSIELNEQNIFVKHSHTAAKIGNYNSCCNDATTRNNSCVDGANNNCLITTNSEVNNTLIDNTNRNNKESTSESIHSNSQTISFTTLEEWLMYIGSVRNVTDALVNYHCVDDFQWLKKVASPHWRCLSSKDEMTMNSTVVTVTVDDPSIISSALTHKEQEYVHGNIINISNTNEDDDNIDESIIK